MSSDIETIRSANGLPPRTPAAGPQASDAVVPSGNRRTSRRLALVIAILLVAIAISGILTYLLPDLFPRSWQLRERIRIPLTRMLFGQQPVAAPLPIFATETTQEITVAADNPALLRELIEHARSRSGRPDTMQRILIRLQSADGERYATASDFFQSYRIAAPASLIATLDPAQFMLFSFSSIEVGRIGMVVHIRDSGQATAALRAWEPAMPVDFAGVSAATSTTTAFTDESYRNIDWRFYKIAPDRDFGIGYGIFPASNYLVIATSRGTMEAAIGRLFTAQP